MAGLGVGPPGPPGLETELLSIVTAPPRANALPVRTAPVPNEMDARAMMFPEMLDVDPRVAELPTCQ